jgi:hypothetical protein
VKTVRMRSIAASTVSMSGAGPAIRSAIAIGGISLGL